jgi:CopG family nickel-responsive transcriptional regulator
MSAGRITISLDEDLLAEFDAATQKLGYTNRSEAFRDMIRDWLQAERFTADDTLPCTGALTYVYDHKERMLGMRLMDTQHERHDLNLSTLHVHLAAETCLETTVLTGPLRQVRELANRILSEPGVRHGHLHVMPAEVSGGGHHHHHDGHGHGHSHDG